MLALTLAASMLVGCGKVEGNTNTSKGETSEGRVVNIYSWNSEFQNLCQNYAEDLAKKHNVKLNFVTISSNNNAYQINLDEALAAKDTAIDDDKVDIFLVEADYAGKYVKSDATLQIIQDIGLSEEDLSGQYQYTNDIVSVDGVLKGVTWQATPGLFAYRRSIAKQVLGTDDPVKVQEMLKNWESFNDVANEMKQSGYYMLSGYDDAYRAFSNNVTQPWVKNGRITIDNNITKWIEETKNYSDAGYNNGTKLWTPQWSADQGPDGNVFGFFYSTWGINFTLLGNALADSSAEQKVGNGLYGDYAVCEGPQTYYWGGTWICAANGTDNPSFVKDLMYRLTCDSETMKQITLDTQDFTNNENAMNEIANSDYKSDFLGGQNHIALFAEAAKNIDMSNVTDYDFDMNEKIQQAMHKYFIGSSTYDMALEEFYTLIMEKYPELKR